MTCGKGKDKIWAHVVCANWIPEMWFTDQKKTTLQGCIPKDRFELAKTGAYINCDYKNCRKAYHVRQAIRQGLIYKWDDMLEDLDYPDSETGMPIFCNNHR